MPVALEANLSMGDRLPHAALAIARRVVGRTAWSAASVSFTGELRVPENDILDAVVLAEAYDRSVRAQLDIARTIGFEAGWRFARWSAQLLA